MRTIPPGAIGCCDGSYDVSRVLIEVPELSRGIWCAQREAIAIFRNFIDKDTALTVSSTTAYYVAFGPHGPRRPPPPDEGRNVFLLSSAVIAGAFAVFAFTRMFASPIRPRTMTKEWQEATEEYMKVCSFYAQTSVSALTHHRRKEPSQSLVTRE